MQDAPFTSTWRDGETAALEIRTGQGSLSLGFDEVLIVFEAPRMAWRNRLLLPNPSVKLRPVLQHRRKPVLSRVQTIVTAFRGRDTELTKRESQKGARMTVGENCVGSWRTRTHKTKWSSSGEIDRESTYFDVSGFRRCLCEKVLPSRLREIAGWFKFGDGSPAWPVHDVGESGNHSPRTIGGSLIAHAQPLLTNMR